MTTIANMTPEELKKLIEATVDQRLTRLLGDFELPELVEEEDDTRSLEEVFASIDQHMWTPPPGAKSSLELLREDRER